MKTPGFLLLLNACVAAAPIAHGTSSDLIIHEWGTFTSFQDEDGITIAGINIDDEPLPEFVHRLKLVEIDNNRIRGAKSSVNLDGGVTMRLETPVIYFYPPKQHDEPFTIDVHVEFRGGVLTEYYPEADIATEGIGSGLNAVGFTRTEAVNGTPVELRQRMAERSREHARTTRGALCWRSLEVGGGWRGPDLKNSYRVWDAPRHVQAAPIRASNGEAEKYLFYRGVGCLESPLRAVAQADDGELALSSTIQSDDPRISYPFRKLWLIQVRPQGRIAFREMDGFTWEASRGVQTLATVPRRFDDSAFDQAHLADLRKSMHEALVEEGLFADEAEAMLNTWEASYFLTPGLRLFYTVPSEWTEAVLPLAFSRPAEVTRVMIGRLELVSDEQRAIINALIEMDESGSLGLLGYRQIAGKLGRFARPLLAHENKFVVSGCLKSAESAASIYYPGGGRAVIPWAYHMPEESRPFWHWR